MWNAPGSGLRASSSAWWNKLFMAPSLATDWWIQTRNIIKILLGSRFRPPWLHSTLKTKLFTNKHLSVFGMYSLFFATGNVLINRKTIYIKKLCLELRMKLTKHMGVQRFNLGETDKINLIRDCKFFLKMGPYRNNNWRTNWGKELKRKNQLSIRLYEASHRVHEL